MATKDELERYLSNIRLFEGECPWMYLDNAKTPNVTCGYGFMLPNSDIAASLKWTIAGNDASVGDVKHEFCRVKAMRGGMLASNYKGNLVLDSEQMVDYVVRQLTDRFIPDATKHCPGFELFPDGVKDCLIDIEWNVGSLSNFPFLCAFCNFVDWAMAAPQSHVSTSRLARNKWRYDSIMSAIGA